MSNRNGFRRFAVALLIIAASATASLATIKVRPPPEFPQTKTVRVNWVRAEPQRVPLNFTGKITITVNVVDGAGRKDSVRIDQVSGAEVASFFSPTYLQFDETQNIVFGEGGLVPHRRGRIVIEASVTNLNAPASRARVEVEVY